MARPPKTYRVQGFTKHSRNLAEKYHLKNNALVAKKKNKKKKNPFLKYKQDPNGYALDILNVHWWSKQREIADALIKHKKVLCKASHGVGKTHIAGSLVNFFFDCYEPSITITTAPTQRQVEQLIWKEVRTQRRTKNYFTGAKSPELYKSETHFARGKTARTATEFQGDHSENMLFLFDEAVSVSNEIWDATQGMFNDGSYWLAIANPTDTASQFYAEEQSGDWHVITISALEHPNIIAEQYGKPVPYPAAIRWNRLNDLIEKWCKPQLGRKQIGDLEWPLDSGQFWIPSTLAETRLLGRWPTQSINNVWSDAIWDHAVKNQLPEPDEPIVIGVDCAREGNDATCWHVRRGNCSLYHDYAYNIKAPELIGKTKELARKWAEHANMDYRDITVNLDSTGYGGELADLGDEYNFVGINSSTRANEPDLYPNKRSELWFYAAELAEKGLLDLSRLSEEAKDSIRRQCMGVLYKYDAKGRRVVEDKKKTKERIRVSPDWIDAMNLAYATEGSSLTVSVI